MTNNLTEAEWDQFYRVAHGMAYVDINVLWPALVKLRGPGMTVGSIDWLRGYCQSIIEAHDTKEKQNDE